MLDVVDSVLVKTCEVLEVVSEYGQRCPLHSGFAQLPTHKL